MGQPCSEHRLPLNLAHWEEDAVWRSARGCWTERLVTDAQCLGRDDTSCSRDGPERAPFVGCQDLTVDLKNILPCPSLRSISEGNAPVAWCVPTAPWRELCEEGCGRPGLRGFLLC